jgi:biopolymer transport protein ExbD
VKADDAEPRFEPPAGALVDIAVRWKGPDAVVEIPAWKLLKPNRVGQEATAIRWVFVGSQMTDAGRYLADIEGTLISVANFPSAVLDVPFASTDQNALLEFSSNTDLLPAQGTEVEVVLTADKQAASAPQARLFISVDRLGRIELDGRIIASSALGQEARKFQAVHSQASAEVRIDAQALVYDRQRVQEALREGGLEEIDFRVAGQEPLPRTAEEAQTALEQWREQLSAGPDALNDPAEDASRFVKGLQRRQEELHTLGALWQQYAGQLQAMIRRAATSRNAAQATSAPGL